TGIFIAYEGALVTGHKCNILIPSLHVDTEIRIVRRQDDDSGYGCEFVKLKPKEEDEILQYLFKRQVEEREIMKRRKDNSE
ncbi:MAG: PilZ domain-containing protein, partial [Oscillospiraceae bacterium]|nr:PilZ domain-containing protein [Oscillospiraceae bacterium]